MAPAIRVLSKPTDVALLRAAFLDRDGTIIEDVGYPHRPEQLRLLAGAVEGLREIASFGYELVIVTNQSGVARGYFTEEDAHAFNSLLIGRLADHGVPIRAAYACPFHPTEGIGRYRQDSPLRKPNPGMLLQASADLGLDLPSSFVIGDKPSDVLAGRRAGCRTILICESKEKAAIALAEADDIAGDLLGAAAVIRRGEARR